jgi:hypothetical protein
MRFPDLSGRPAIVHFFFGELTVVPHFGHFAIKSPSIQVLIHGLLMMMDK